VYLYEVQCRYRHPPNVVRVVEDFSVPTAASCLRRRKAVPAPGTRIAGSLVEASMTTRSSAGALFLAAALIAAASAAQAQPTAEVGASLVSATFGLGDDDVTTFGVPSGGFGILNPGVYASFFIGSYAAVEPQLGFIWASGNGSSEHLLNFTGQFDYYFSGTEVPSPYVFGTAGLVDASEQDYTPKSYGFGGGYRIPVGGRLTFRVDGRWVRYTSQFGDDRDTLGFALSIGGIF
jgi:hypothetical protein